MAALEPLPMSQKKEDLIKHLNMHPDIYTIMANETDLVYKWLTSDKRHLKHNGKRKPPYDWSDIVEKSKDEAINRIAQSGDAYTSYYWNLAPAGENWIARWFLYHKFRYRDGRNRNPVKRGEGKRHHQHEYDVEESNGYHGNYYGYHPKESIAADQDPQGYGSSATGSTTTPNGYGTDEYSFATSTYQYASTTATFYRGEPYDGPTKSCGYWDPVRGKVVN